MKSGVVHGVVHTDSLYPCLIIANNSAEEVREVALLEELGDAARRLSPGAGGEALARLLRAGELLEANVSPELLLDVLLLHWPGPARAA